MAPLTAEPSLQPSPSFFLWLNSILLCGHTTLCLYLLQLIHTWAVVDNDVMNIHAQGLLYRQMHSWLLDIELGVEAVGDSVTLCLSEVPKQLHPFVFPPAMHGVPIHPPSRQHLLESFRVSPPAVWG